MPTVQAIIVHKAEPWTPTEGSLLLLFKDFGMKIWLRPEQMLNYNAIDHMDNHHFQEFIINDFVSENIRIAIVQRKLELLYYKKGRKIK